MHLLFRTAISSGLLALVFLGCVPSTSSGSILYGIENTTTKGSRQQHKRKSSWLVSIDTHTGKTTRIGNEFRTRISQLAFDHKGNLYGSDASGLYRIDKTTGTIDRLGDHVDENGSYLDVYGLGSRGSLYGVNETHLVTMDSTDGSVANQLALSYGATQLTASGMAFRDDGLLFVSAEYEGEDELGHSVTRRGLFMSSRFVKSTQHKRSKRFRLLHEDYGKSFLTSLEFDRHGQLFGLTSAGNTIYQVDQKSGELSASIALDGKTRLDAFAFDPSASAVPEPGTVLIWSCMGLIGASVLTRRRRSLRK